MELRLPVSQQRLGDVLGLSTVHMSRSIQELRRTELVTWMGDEDRILRPALPC